MDFLFWLFELRQRGEPVIVFGNVRIINGAIMLRHFQRGVSQLLLEHERIAAAIHQIFAGEGVPVKVCACFLHATGLVVPGDGQPQTIHGEHAAVLVAE